MVGWHHRLNGHEREQTLGDGEGQRSLCAANKELATDSTTNSIHASCPKAAMGISHVDYGVSETYVTLSLLPLQFILQVTAPVTFNWKNDFSVFILNSSIIPQWPLVKMQSSCAVSDFLLSSPLHRPLQFHLESLLCSLCSEHTELLLSFTPKSP